jgi:lysine decarboxylase
MDQYQAPILDGLVDHQVKDRYGFTPPGHRQGRGVDQQTPDLLGLDPFRNDVLASAGMDHAPGTSSSAVTPTSRSPPG